MIIKGPNARTESIKTSAMPIANSDAWCFGGETGTLGDFFNMITSITLENGYKGIVVTMGSKTSADRPLDHAKLAIYCKNSFRYPTPSEITKIQIV